MTRPNLSVVWSAQKTAAPVGNAKEPPQRPASESRIATFAALTRQRPYDFKKWRDMLEAVAPFSHPNMPFDDYTTYEAKLHGAVAVLNETFQVDNPAAAEDVMAAFERLRTARYNGNAYNLTQYCGMNEQQLKNEDLQALMRLAMTAKDGTALRAALETRWLREQMQREAGKGREALYQDLRSGFENTIPGTREEALYQLLHQKLQERSDLRDRAARSKIALG